jgi:hypothetical protein
VLADGEFGLDKDLDAFKVGDGTTAWNDLEFFNTSLQMLVGSVDGVLAVDTGKKRIPITANGDLRVVSITVDTVPTGADSIIDVNKNGSTVFTTQGDRTTITAGTNEGTSVPNVTPVVVGDYITVDVDQVGSTVAGSDLVVVIEVEAY